MCLPAHALPLCTSSQVAHRGSLHWMQADTFIVSYPLLQKLESLSLIDEAWLVSGTLPANTHKNRSKDVLPCECARHLRTYTTPTPSSQLQCFGYTHAIHFQHWCGELLFSHAFPIVTSNLIHSSTSPPSSSDDPYRVRLTMFPGVEGSDYINSTYMDVSKAQTSVTLTLIVFVIIISIL